MVAKAAICKHEIHNMSTYIDDDWTKLIFLVSLFLKM